MPRVGYTFIISLIVLSFSTGSVVGQNNFLNFDGGTGADGTDYVSLGNFGTLPNWTIELCFHPNGENNYENLYTSDDLGGNVNNIRVEMSSNYPSGHLWVLIAGGFHTIVPLVSSLPDQWHHLAIVGDQSNNILRIYFNGTEVVNTANTAWPTSFPDFVLGRGWLLNANRDFTGSMDEFRIWNVARSEAEILAAKDNELSGSEPGLIAYYNFNQGTCGDNNTGLTAPEIPNIANPGTNDGTMMNMAKNGCTSNFVCAGPTCAAFTATPVASVGVVPTLSEWGLIIFALLLLTIGIVAIKSRDMVFAGAGSDQRISLKQLPFDNALFAKLLLVVSLAVMAIFTLAIAFFGYELTNADIPGSIIASSILAYLLHLVLLED